MTTTRALLSAMMAALVFSSQLGLCQSPQPAPPLTIHVTSDLVFLDVTVLD